jgi:hypothetical protein
MSVFPAPDRDLSDDGRCLMRISRDDRICGLPAEAARTLMRQFRRSRPETDISVLIDADPRSGAEIAREFAAEGYLQLNADDVDGERWWETTTAGNALAQASFGRPITRATAARHLTAVLDRAEAFNADASRLVAIREILVFGSYLDPYADTLGDLDLAVSFVSRLPADAIRDEHTEQLLAYARASGRRFASFVDRLFWPQQEALLILRNRSAAINITCEDVRSLTDRWQIVYPVAESQEQEQHTGTVDTAPDHPPVARVTPARTGGRTMLPELSWDDLPAGPLSGLQAWLWRTRKGTVVHGGPHCPSLSRSAPIPTEHHLGDGQRLGDLNWPPTLHCDLDVGEDAAQYLRDARRIVTDRAAAIAALAALPSGDHSCVAHSGRSQAWRWWAFGPVLAAAALSAPESQRQLHPDLAALDDATHDRVDLRRRLPHPPAGPLPRRVRA